MVDDITWDQAGVREPDWVPGCYYPVRREVVDEVSLFDPLFFPYYEKADHCKRVKPPRRHVVYFPNTLVVHIGGGSAGSDVVISESGRRISALQVESEMLCFRKQHALSGRWIHLVLTVLGDGYVSARTCSKVPACAVLHHTGAMLGLTRQWLLQANQAMHPTR